MEFFDLSQWPSLYSISEWMIRLVMLVYVPQRRSAAAARSWLLLIFLLPWPGLLLYSLFGRIYLSDDHIAEQDKASRYVHNLRPHINSVITEPPKLPDHFMATISIAEKLGDFQCYAGNSIDLLANYENSIDRLITDINSAQSHINALYYTFEPDATGHQVTEALIQAAKRGVVCKIMMDSVGSRSGLQKLAPVMRNAGIEVVEVLPAGLFRRKTWRFDLRNHRKIAVIDGQIGYAGSQNIIAATTNSDFPNEELVVRTTGPVVEQLQAVFFMDYYFATGNLETNPIYLPSIIATGHSHAQVVPSSPGYRRENGKVLMISLFYAAKKRIVITTPYFVPDEIFLQAIRSATLRGVEVHLVLSKYSDQRITKLAQCSCYENLLEVGVKIHLYQPRFLHAKHLSVDNDVALIGSTNIDIRSFALNSEINVLVYDKKVVKDLRAIQEQYFSESKLLTLKDWQSRPLLARVSQNIARLADSLL